MFGKRQAIIWMTPKKRRHYLKVTKKGMWNDPSPRDDFPKKKRGSYLA